MKTKICILGLDDYPVLSATESSERTGGESVQHMLLARAWRDMGLDVTMVVRDHGQARDLEIDGIRVLSTFHEDEGVRGLRFFHPRLTGVVRALKAADADVYYQSPSSAYTGVVAWFCRRYGRRFIYRIASDANCVPGQQLIRFWRDRKLYEYGMRRADLIAVQTEHQRAELLKHYGLASEVVNMAVEPPASSEPEKQVRDIDVLWVSNMRSVKRPELALELARRLPQFSFALAGGALPGARSYYEHIVSEAAKLKNVTCLGAVPYSCIGHLFDRARVFVNTSSLEGFPNTFLQAWIRGMPVVTFFDPDNLVRQRRLGRAVQSMDEMALAVKELLSNRETLQDCGTRARHFALERYSAAQVAGRYLKLLEQRPGSVPAAAQPETRLAEP